MALNNSRAIFLKAVSVCSGTALTVYVVMPAGLCNPTVIMFSEPQCLKTVNYS